MFSRLVVMLALCALAVPAAAQPSAATDVASDISLGVNAQVISQLDASLVQVARGTRSGLGIVFGSPLRVVTSLWLVDTRGKLRVRGKGGESRAEVVAVDRVHALAVLELESDVQAVGWPSDRLGDPKLSLGDELWMLSRPIHSRMTPIGKVGWRAASVVSFQRVSAVEKDRFWIEGRTSSSEQGAPLLSKDGKLIGLRGRVDDLPDGLARASHLRDMLAAASAKPSTQAFRPRATQAMGFGLGLAAGRGVGPDVRLHYRRNYLAVGLHVQMTFRDLLPMERDVFEERFRSSAFVTLGGRLPLGPTDALALGVGPAIAVREKTTLQVGDTRSEKTEKSVTRERVRPQLDLTWHSGSFYLGFSMELWSHPAAYFSVGLGSESTRW